ncbi:hypothetical protein QQ045_002736 [Rhodiola kirilowii]
MSNMSDDSDDVYMFTLATLDNPIIDKYDRDEMEELDNIADENPDAKIVQDRIIWDHPSFIDISAWETYRPFDENGEEVCLWRLRVVVMERTSYWTIRKYGGDHICHNNIILQSNIHLNAHFIAREMWNAMSENTSEVLLRTDAEYNSTRLWVSNKLLEGMESTIESVGQLVRQMRRIIQ